MSQEKRIGILRAAHDHAVALAAYIDQGGIFPTSQSVGPSVSAAVGYFLKKAAVWSEAGGKANGILTPIFKRATRPRHRAAFSSGTPLPQFSGTLRIVLNAENGCAVGGDRSGKVLSFFRRVVELTAEELKKIEG